MTLDATISAPPPPAILRQTLAILHDAYREMNSRKMFWIVLILSGVAMAGFAIVSVTPYGLSLAGYEWDTPFIPAKSQYKLLFSYLMIDWWLTWAVLILALISTAGIFPEFISGGSIDLFISKPISRLRLFLTKYFAGMLFAFLQIAVFAVAAFFVVGIRGKIWEPRLFMAIPIVLCLFSYLYAISVLLGVVTRSTIATLLLTILAWGLIGGMHYSETRLLAFEHIYQRRLETIDRQLAELDRAPPATRPTSQPTSQTAINPATRPAAPSAMRSLANMLGIKPGLPRLSPERDRLVARRKTSADDLKFFRRWSRIAHPIHLILPKTSETTDMLDRALSSDEYLDLLEGKRDEMQSRFRRQVRETDIFYVNDEVELIRRARSRKMTILSSLGFEVVMVGIAAWLFCRRDF